MLIAAAEAGDADAVLKAIDCARAYKRLAEMRQFRAVEQLDAETSAVLAHWPSQAAAAADLGIHTQAISRACRDVRRTAGGFAWRFAATADTILDGDGEPWVCCDLCDKWRRIARVEERLVRRAGGRRGDLAPAGGRRGAQRVRATGARK